MRTSGRRGRGGECAQRGEETRLRRGANDRERSRGDLYAEVTARIIAELEAGRFPWAQPWMSAKAAGRDEAGGLGAAPLSLPKNAATGACYSGINILLLWGAAEEAGFSSPYWLTFRQALALGGAVQRGETGSLVVYADRFIPKREAERVAAEGGEAEAVAFLKRYVVFNTEQCERLPERFFSPQPPVDPCDAVPRAEALIRASGADVRVGGDKAFYVPSQDFIRVPPQAAFFEPVNYYRTCFHELGHWTSHASRLNREFKGRYGSHAYAREELVAELSSAFVCASLSITPTVRHADYLGAWLEVLKEDNRAIFNAASLASKAADFILAFDSA
jgi:antirestriction protein ArdC